MEVCWTARDYDWEEQRVSYANEWEIRCPSNVDENGDEIPPSPFGNWGFPIMVTDSDTDPEVDDTHRIYVINSIQFHDFLTLLDGYTRVYSWNTS